jgi:hypothetical protein
MRGAAAVLCDFCFCGEVHAPRTETQSLRERLRYVFVRIRCKSRRSEKSGVRLAGWHEAVDNWAMMDEFLRKVMLFTEQCRRIPPLSTVAFRNGRHGRMKRQHTRRQGLMCLTMLSIYGPCPLALRPHAHHRRRRHGVPVKQFAVVMELFSVCTLRNARNPRFTRYDTCNEC